MGRKHLNVLRDCFADKIKIAGILNSTPQSTLAAAQKLGVTPLESLEKISKRRVDAAIISTPAENHFETAKILIQKHIPLLIEKPFASDEVQCFELIKLAQKYKVPILVGHTENYNPAVTLFKKLLDAPLKSIAGIRTSQNGGLKKTHIISELMIHDLAIITSLLPGSWVKALIDKKSEYRWDEHAIIELMYECGTIVKLEALRHSDCAINRKMRLIDAKNNIW